MKNLTTFGVSAVILMLALPSATLSADDNSKTAQVTEWRYHADLMRPFWRGDFVDGESVLFIKDPSTGEATAKVLFPIRKIVSVTRSVDWNVPGGMKFEEGRDFVITQGSREIRLPKDSRIPSFTADQLRVPAGSQKYKLTHRDGNGEIMFAAGAEYHLLQVSVSYQQTGEQWPAVVPEFSENALPRTIQKLKDKAPVSVVLLGDSISAGCNASGWAGCSPYQPPYQELLLEHLRHQSSPNITLTNLSVGGTSTPWGLTRVPDVLAASPDLVLLAFGMNDSSGRAADEYQSNIQSMMEEIRKARPETEFILVASMLGNRDWITLKHELFPQYQRKLRELVEPGVALADMTSIWTEMLKRKQDWDLTGNGVNHPNDFGHRIYAQVLTSLLLPSENADVVKRNPAEPLAISLWPEEAPIGDGTFEKSEAKMTVHLPEQPGGSAIIICPGGGYGGLVTGPEGHGIAKWLNSYGIAGLVLEYRLPAGRSHVPLLDAQRAIRLARAHAEEWKIDPSQIGIMGFSAGGHLASTATTHFDGGAKDDADPVQTFGCRPDFAVLVYPVVSMGPSTHSGSRKNLLGDSPSQELMDQFSAEKQVTENTPPVFLTHALDDTVVSSVNSEVLYQALQEKNIPAMYLKLPTGGHGLNGYKGPMWDAWQKESIEWLSAQGLIQLAR